MLEKARNVDRLNKMKQDRRIRQEILRATKGPDLSKAVMDGNTSMRSSRQGRSPGGRSDRSEGGGGGLGTFLTDGGGGRSPGDLGSSADMIHYGEMR